MDPKGGMYSWKDTSTHTFTHTHKHKTNAQIIHILHERVGTVTAKLGKGLCASEQYFFFLTRLDLVSIILVSWE